MLRNLVLGTLVIVLPVGAVTIARRNLPNAPYKTFWQRLAAGSLDALLFAPLAEVDWWIATLNGKPWLLAAWFLSYAFGALVYGTFCHALWGQTLGKWVFGVCVLDVAETRLRPMQAIRRDIVPILLTAAWVAGPMARGDYVPAQSQSLDTMSALSTTWFALEVMTMMWNPKRRALHDHLAGSVVVRVVPLWRRKAA